MQEERKLSFNLAAVLCKCHSIKIKSAFVKEFVSSFVFSEGRVIVTPSFHFMNVSNFSL